MSCSNLTTGRNAAGACKIIGGVEKVYLANSDLITAVTTSGSDATEAIDSITSDVVPFYEFGQIQETSSFTATPTANVQNGSLFYENILTLVFTNYDASLRYTIKTLSENNLVAVVVMKSGEYVYLGESGGLDISGGAGGSGVAAGDRNGAQLDFRGIDANPPLTIDAAFIAAGFDALVNA